MGLVIKAELDTSRGSTKEAYIRIETCRINKVQAQLEFTTTCWINKKAASKFYRKYLDDPLTNAGGLVNKEVVFYKDKDDIDGTEVAIENYYKVPTVNEVTIEEPVYEKKVVVKQVPFISFDENGDEIEKIKTVEREEKVQVDTKTKKRKLIDYSLMNKPFEFAYQYLKEELEKKFGKDKIVKQ